MKIQEKHSYHGAALAQIVEHESFKALNKEDEYYGHYLVNRDRRLLVKHRSTMDSPWQFTFTTRDLAVIRRDVGRNGSFLVGLVCGRYTVCALDEGHLDAVLDLNSSKQQWVKVASEAGKSMRVTGSAGVLGGTIPHNSFPRRVFLG